ncbi:MAG: VWA domain-containing protein [Phycisphaerae bacterium]|jgi:hypothetical protein|nr:VWA domain-containing protein [Phycisphaerae bacterium]
MILSTADNLVAAAGVFAQPWWLAALVVVVAPILLAAAARRCGRQIARLSVVMQCVALAAVTVALARPSVQIPRAAAKEWMILNDVSASTRTQQTQDLPEDITPRLEYVFAAGVAPSGQDLDTTQTNLAAALRLAAARSGELAGVIIRTDGVFTDTHWPAAAEALARDGVTVAIVPFDRPPRDVRIVEFTAARGTGQAVTLRVSVLANAVTDSVIEIRSSSGQGKSLLKRKISLLPSEPITISVVAAVGEDRGASFSAMLAKGDAFSENDRVSAAVGPVVRRVALISAPGGYKPANFAAAVGMSVHTASPEQLGAGGEALGNYAAVVLVDDTGQLLSPVQRGALAQYMRHGGGLVILGAGPHQSPADRLDPLNRAAALVPNPYDRKPIALTVAIDASGSMGQTVESAAGQLMKFDQAAQAALSLKRHLTDRDTLRVIVFADRAKEIYTSGTDRPDFAKLATALHGVRPTGATNVFPALELAAGRPPDAKRQGLLIIVSDLQTEKFDPPRVAEMLKTAKLDLAIVAISAPTATPSTEPLEVLKKLLDAPLAKRDHLVGLARIFAGFLRTVRGGAVRRGQFTLSPQNPSPDSAALAGKSADAYILSAAGSDANVTLQIGSDAILARRTVGLGRSVSLALASAGGANRALLATGEFTAVLASATKWAARPAADARFSGEVTRGGREALVTLRAADSAGAPINMLELSAGALAGLDDNAEKIPMQQIAPGRYTANFELGESASDFHVVDAGGRVVWRGGLQKTYPREFDAIGPNYTNLRRLAALTGGRLVEAPALAEIARTNRQTGRWEIWPWLAAVALTLMLLDWLASRTIQRSTVAS